MHQRTRAPQRFGDEPPGLHEHPPRRLANHLDMLTQIGALRRRWCGNQEGAIGQRCGAKQVFFAEFHSFRGTLGSAPSCANVATPDAKGLVERTSFRDELLARPQLRLGGRLQHPVHRVAATRQPAHLRTTKRGFAWSIVSEVPPVPLVTVVIPVFNRERTVVAAIESVLRQTYQSIEVIVVDDASTDGSIDAVRSVSDPRVRLVEAGANRGAPGARNLGIATATGEFVAFQDSDDEWLPTKLQRQMDLFESRVVAVYCGMAIVEPQGSGRINVRYNPPSNIPNPSGDLLNLLLESSIVSTQTLVVRRNALDVVDGFDESLPATEDWDLAIRLAKVGPIIFVDDLLVVQRFSANSLTRNAASRLSALQQVVEKHLDEYQLRPRVLARRYYELAGGHRQFGNLRRAAGFLRKARQADRSFYRVWLGYLLLASHRLLRRS